MTKQEAEKAVVDGLSTLIRHELITHDAEYTRPQLGSDASDYLMKVTSARVEALRAIRDQFENVMSASTKEAP